MVKLFGEDIISQELKVYQAIALRKCRVKPPSPLPTTASYSHSSEDEDDLLDDWPEPEPEHDDVPPAVSNAEVPLCLQCGDPAGDFFIGGDMQFCEDCFLRLQA